MDNEFNNHYSNFGGVFASFSELFMKLCGNVLRVLMKDKRIIFEIREQKRNAYIYG
jgi:hypothetical protein